MELADDFLNRDLSRRGYCEELASNYDEDHILALLSWHHGQTMSAQLCCNTVRTLTTQGRIGILNMLPVERMPLVVTPQHEKACDQCRYADDLAMVLGEVIRVRE